MICGEARHLFVPFQTDGRDFRYDTRGLIPLAKLRAEEELYEAFSALSRVPGQLEEFMLKEESVSFRPEELYFSAVRRTLLLTLRTPEQGPSSLTPAEQLTFWVNERLEEELILPEADPGYLTELLYLKRALLLTKTLREATDRYLSEKASRRLAGEENESPPELPEEVGERKSSLLKEVFNGIMKHNVLP